MILESAALCLALNIYHEARGEMIPGQYGIAHVTMNRAKSSKNVCAAVVAKGQFSWTQENVEQRGNKFVLKPTGYPHDAHAWWVANRVASYTINMQPADLTYGATHFHAKHVRPDWSRRLVRTKTMGSHVFYRTNQSLVTEYK